MTTGAPTKEDHEPSRVNTVSEKPVENPELAKLIRELSTSTDDVWELVKGLMQESTNAGPQMDTPLRYEHSDRNARAQLVTAVSDNPRNGSCPKTVSSGYGPLEVTMPRDRAGFRSQMLPY